MALPAIGRRHNSGPWQWNKQREVGRVRCVQEHRPCYNIQTKAIKKADGLKQQSGFSYYLQECKSGVTPLKLMALQRYLSGTKSVSLFPVVVQCLGKGPDPGPCAELE